MRKEALTEMTLPASSFALVRLNLCCHFLMHRVMRNLVVAPIH